jgi:hypothetical protein
LQIKKLMEANREMTSTSSSCWPDISGSWYTYIIRTNENTF